MAEIFFILSAAAAVAVVASLAGGMAVMTRGGDTDRKYSNKFMQARLIAQGLAVLFLVLGVLSLRGG